MDIEYAVWMIAQLVVSPKTAYRHVSYHKQTRDQWSRDDPAFTVMCCILQALCSFAWCVAYEHSWKRAVGTIAWSVFVDLLGAGVVVATLGSMLANRWMKKAAQPGGFSPAVDQAVEWGYCFDVHMNSWVPALLLTGVVQYILSPVLLLNGLVPRLLSAVLWAASFLYYGYLSFLGYSVLPMLTPSRVKVLLWWPLVAVTVLAPLLVLFGVNLTRWYVWVWFFR